MFEQSCDNCLYRDECPDEFQMEQPNWCENWEFGSDELSVVNQIAHEIISHRLTNVSDLVFWCLENNCFADLRRNFAVYQELLFEAKKSPSPMTRGLR